MSIIFLDKSKICILLLEGVYQFVVENFECVGYINIEYLKIFLLEEEFKIKIVDVYFVGICLCIQLIEDVFEVVKKLVVVGCFCIGINQVNLNFVLICGIFVFNVFFFNICLVVELVLVEVILLLCGILEKNVICYCGGWQKMAINSFEICNKMLGIVGYGSIGLQFSVIVENLGMKVIFQDVVIKLLLGNVVQVGSLDELLERVDIVMLYVLEIDVIKYMIGKE